MQSRPECGKLRVINLPRLFLQFIYFRYACQLLQHAKYERVLKVQDNEIVISEDEEEVREIPDEEGDVPADAVNFGSVEATSSLLDMLEESMQPQVLLKKLLPRASESGDHALVKTSRAQTYLSQVLWRGESGEAAAAAKPAAVAARPGVEGGQGRRRHGRRENPAYRWVFTINNYTEEECAALTLNTV
uniref:Uncharacterized protein n=1 Tax=Branchiostoma floridae TaxID=7739 RepID=C3YHF6_BRAFL|eukprot:XP_002604381.1 hypothetical protein BRAFLDRAFT_73367 [Branchiostoma floridae]